MEGCTMYEVYDETENKVLYTSEEHFDAYDKMLSILGMDDLTYSSTGAEEYVYIRRKDG
jgi:dsDNA-binding SOS-regulon protein